MKVNNALMKFFKRTGMKPSEASEKTGIATDKLIAYTKGEITPDGQTLQKIQKGLDIDPACFFLLAFGDEDYSDNIVTVARAIRPKVDEIILDYLTKKNVVEMPAEVKESVSDDYRLQFVFNPYTYDFTLKLGKGELATMEVLNLNNAALSLRSLDGSVITNLEFNMDDTLMLTVNAIDSQTGEVKNTLIWRGTEDYDKKLIAIVHSKKSFGTLTDQLAKTK